MRLGIRHRRLQLLSPPSSEVSDDESVDHDLDIEYTDDVQHEQEILIDDTAEPEPPTKRQKTDFINNETMEPELPASPNAEFYNLDDNAATQLSYVNVKLREWASYKVCPQCGIKVGHRNLPRHIRECHEPASARLTCELCGKEFRRKESLHNHV